MARAGGGLLLGLLALLIAAGPGLAEGLRLECRPQNPRQGEVMVVRAQGRLAGARADFMGRSYGLMPEGPGTLVGLIGIDLAARPGRHTLKITAEDMAGQSLINNCQIEVRPGEFGLEELSLPEEMVTLDAATLARVKKEKARLRAAMSKGHNKRLWQGGFIKPLPTEVSGSFGTRRIINGEPRSPHSGIDLKARTGQEVAAAASGRVVLVGEFFFEGRTIVIDHGNSLFTIYCHLKEIKAKPAQFVSKGQIIGLAGRSGRATGPHLHFAAKLNGARIDPLALIEASQGIKERW